MVALQFLVLPVLVRIQVRQLLNKIRKSFDLRILLFIVISAKKIRRTSETDGGTKFLIEKKRKSIRFF